MKNTRIIFIALSCSFLYILIVTTSLYNSDYISSFNNNEWYGSSFELDLTNEEEGDDDNGDRTTSRKKFAVATGKIKNDNKKREIQCPSGLVPLEDVIVHVTTNRDQYNNNNNNNNSPSIEPVVHVIVESKCIAQKAKQFIIHKWKSKRFSLKFHDRSDLKQLIEKGIHKFPNLHIVMKCTLSSIEHETDLFKFVLLWEEGGLVTDTNYIFNGGQSIIDKYIGKNDEAFFLMKNETASNSITYDFGVAGATKYHPISYMFIQKTISHLYEQFDDAKIFKASEDQRRYHIFRYPIETFFPQLLLDDDGHDDDDDRDRHVHVESYKSKKRYMGIYNRTISLFDTNDRDYIKLIQKQNETYNNITKFEPSLQLQPRKQSELKSCFNFDKTYPTNYQDLKDMTDTESKLHSCEAPLDYMENVYNDQYGKFTQTSKIPKIIHMTSKTRCLTKNYTTNAHTWLYPDHSIVFHDDDAVAKLINRQWLEFPHLQDASTCITSGAGMADLWRYLMLWEFGGIYTDLDNSPGPKMTNDLLTDDNTDAFLEVETGNFPSQYFIAVAPHHPLMYFAVNVAMQRLYEENNIVQQYVPYITGPGALKSAMIHTIANGNPQNGTHIGINNRTVTMVGNRKSARLLEYINRGSVSNHEYGAMNMTHYSIAGRQKHLPRKPCLQVLYEKTL